MSTVALAKKISYEKTKDPKQGEIIIEPMFPGYGLTLGNSLRRVLLSSLPGAAPVGVKIKDSQHEFTAIAHLQEDILEFILNLKKIRLKVFSEDVIRLSLEIHGKKKITAGDITKDSNVEIVNPELVLGHITDMSGSLQAEIFVSQGMGYETVESREKKEKEIGYIEMDSIFSPVLQTGIKVENVRVGKMTNWDRLKLNITTDGTITPKEAFSQAVEILIDQFGALRKDKKKPAKEKKEDNKPGKDEADVKKKESEENKEEKPKPDQEESRPKRKRGRPKKGE